jgi:arylsulfatase A-like enzyme
MFSFTRYWWLALLGMLSCSRAPEPSVSSLELLEQSGDWHGSFYRIPPGRSAWPERSQPAHLLSLVLVRNATTSPQRLNLGAGQLVELGPQQERWVTIQGPMEDVIATGEFHVSRPIVARKDDRRAPVALISVDTLRFDAFQDQLMPRLTMRTGSGSHFNRAYATAPWTLPSHASVFTSQYPVDHGVRLPDHRLPQSALTLAEAFAQSGYFCVAITEGNYLGPQYQLNQGFHLYLSNPPDMMSQDPEKNSKLQVNLTVLEQLVAAFPDQPLFVFFHTYEVHCPYLDATASAEEQKLGETQWLLENEKNPPSAAEFRVIRNLYDREVRLTDRLLGTSLEKLPLDRWVMCLFSDHGEEFGEHGGLLHADTLFEEVVHVPLVFFGKGIPTEKRQELVSLIDVGPTLCDLTGVPRPASWKGTSLFEPLGESGRMVFFESYFWGPHYQVSFPRLVGLRVNAFKWIQMDWDQNRRTFCFDVDADPTEQYNLIEGTLPESVDPEALREALNLYMNQKVISEQRGALTSEQLDVMRSLGYTQ